MLTQLEGVPYDRAAELLNTTAGTIKSRVNRARTKLREWMSEGLPDKHRELAAKKHVQQRERREQ